MLCKEPIKVRVGNRLSVATSSGIALVPCGQCLNCCVNKARIWTNRIILEACCHGDTSFVTLTFDKYNLPNPPLLSVPLMQKYIKRVRYHTGKKMRYFCVGEYGEGQGERELNPHYHLIMYNIHPVTDWKHLAESWKNDDGCLMCEPERLQAVDLTPELARYAAGYVTKKAKDERNQWCFESQKKLHCEGLREWAIFSKGLGKEAIKKARYEAWKWDHEINTLRTGGRKYPIGRYLKEFARKKRNWTEQLLEFRAGQEKAFRQRLETPRTAKIKQERRAL
jgi:hypothetical protein